MRERAASAAGCVGPHNWVRAHLCAQAEEMPGFLLALLAVVTQEGVPVPIALQAALQFKRTMSYKWSNSGATEGAPMSEGEREAVRAAVLKVGAVLRSPTRVCGHPPLCPHRLPFPPSLCPSSLRSHSPSL